MTDKTKQPDRSKGQIELSALASSLKGFLSANRRTYPSMTAFAKAVGLSRHTIMQICDGRLANVTIKTRRAIFAATGLTEFSPPSRGEASAGTGPRTRPIQSSPVAELQCLKAAAEEILRSVTRLQDLARSDLGPFVVPIKSDSPDQHVERIRQVLSALDQELSFFKERSRERERELLRARIDPKDVGYIIALLRALYSKEAFDNWVLASGYSVR